MGNWVRYMRIVGMCLLVATMFLVACGRASDAPSSGSLRKITVYLPLPVKTIAMFPLVIPEELGYFEEEGLEVDLQTTDSSSLIIQQMAAGNGEAGWVVSGTAMNALAQGNDFISVHEFLVRPVFSLIVPEDSPIQSIADLRGKTVGMENPAGGDLPELRADLENEGLSVGKDVTLIAMGEDMGAVWEQVKAGKADAFNISYNNRVRLEGSGVKFREIGKPVDPSKLRPSVPLLVHRKVVENEPNVVIGLGRAINKAIIFAHANPDAALAIQKKAFPPEHDDPEFARLYMKRAIEMSWPTDESRLSRLGEQSLEGWQELQDILISGSTEVEGLKERFDLEPLITNEFIEQMNDFDRQKIEEEARNSNLTYP